MPPKRSSRPGKAVALLEIPRDSGASKGPHSKDQEGSQGSQTGQVWSP